MFVLKDVLVASHERMFVLQDVLVAGYMRRTAS